jgi:Leucine-rich repeat (LRR) protein
MRKVLILLIILFPGSSFSQSDSAGISGKPTPPVISGHEEVNLSGMKLAELPREIFEMENLRILDVSNNNLTLLPGKIKKLKNLRVLDISGNSIYELPFELKRLKFLKEIYLDYDYWHTRQKEVRKLTNARIILR